MVWVAVTILQHQDDPAVRADLYPIHVKAGLPCASQRPGEIRLFECSRSVAHGITYAPAATSKLPAEQLASYAVG